MLSRVVGDLYRVHLEAVVALPYVVDPGDVGAHFIHHLHKLGKENNICKILPKMFDNPNKLCGYDGEPARK